MEDSEAGSDADEEKDVEEVEAVEAKAPTPEPSAPPSPERAPPRRRIREPVDLGTALGPDWDPEAPAKVETFDALKRVFDEADEDSDGELGVDDFVKAFRHLDPELRDAREALRRARSEARSDSYADAGSANADDDAGVPRDENDDLENDDDVSLVVDPALEAAVDYRMRHLFAIMDTNAGDTVDWDEFSTHVMLTAKEMRDKARALQPPSRYAPPHDSQCVIFDKQTRHNDLVTNITRMPRVDQYATVSRDGSVRAWSLDDASKTATLRKKVNVGVGFLNDAAELPVTGRLAVACFDRSVRVFDPKAWSETGAFRALKDAPLCVAGWAGGKRLAPGARDVDYVAVGDVGGHVHFLKVIDTTDGEKAERPGVGVRFEKPWSARDVHKRAWVTCLCYVSSLNAIATGGSDGCAALVDVDGREGGGHVRRRFTKNAHVKGVNAIAWSEERKTLYTAGDDRVVKLWNPLSEGPVAQLAGHEHPVTSVLCVDEEDQLVTLDLGKTFKVWDVRTRKCLQTFTDDQEYHPENAVGSLCFDPKRRSLVTASVQPKVWALETNVRGNVDAHAAAVVSVNFSKAFQRACSADEDGVVCVWDLRDGGRVFRFNADGEAAADAAVADDDDAVAAHADAASGGAAGDALKAPTAAAVISARLDGRGRRIVVGGGDGSVRCWNIANGALCKELFKEGEDPRARAAEKAASSAAAARGSEQKIASSSADRPETARVTGVCTIGDYPDVRFAAAGWSREMTLWDDSHDASIETPRRVVRGHQSDILFCACNDESTVLATGDFAGNVFVWSDMGERRAKLEPPPLPPDRDVSGDVDADASGSDHEPTADRAAECAAWLATRRGEREHRGTGLPHTFLFVGHADGHVRAWDVKDGRLACDFFAGHKPGESIVSVAIDPEGSRLVTGDSVGRVRLWDVKSAVDEMHRASRGLRELSTDPTLKTLIRRKDVECLGYWQAHESRTCVQALEFFRVEAFGEETPRLFFASGGEDAAAHLWSFEGQHIGQFGPDVWQLDDPKTWRSAELPVGSDEAARQTAEARDAERRAAKAARRAARLARDVSSARPPDGDEEETATPPSLTREDGQESPAAIFETENAAGDPVANADRDVPDFPATPGSGLAKETSSASGGLTDNPDAPDTLPSLPSSSSPETDGTNSSLTSSPTEPSPTSTIDSTALPDPFPSPPGYKPVRPVEDRLRWTRDTKNSFEASGTYREIKALEEKKHPLRDASLPELRARSEKLSRKKPAWHTRVYIPEGDEHINKPRSRGRPYTSLHHLIHISDVAAIPKRPTTRAGRFKYGSPIKDTPTASPEKHATKTKGKS